MSALQSALRGIVQNIDWKSLAIGIVIGLLVFSFINYVVQDSSGFLQNLVPEAVGMIFTVIILDNLNKVREERSMIQQLVRRVHSRYNATALAAIEELRVLGKLQDGTLRKKELRGSNWQDANLYEANLEGCDLINANLFKADFVKANLKGVSVTEEQLASTETIAKAIMPDGKRYDGRYNLVGDFAWAKRKNVNLKSDTQMAAFYEVTLEEYKAGQVWWEANKSRFKLRSLKYDETSDGNIIQ
jgi:hypothetical protein